MLSAKRNLVGKLQRSLLSTAPAGEYEGIRICDFGSKADGFKGVIISSIDLIKTIDPRRFKTVRRHVEWLININDPPKFGGNYQKSIRRCFIHFDNYSEDQCLVSAFYAGLIVHEATHGLLISKGFRYMSARGFKLKESAQQSKTDSIKRSKMYSNNTPVS